MENIIILLILVAVVGCAIYYIVREKKRGRACIGCPSSGTCPRKQCGCKK
ncbi:MAG: FeoB-associated Cys-rich membrane protein [Lachnospiraceae bacterium]|nr:FeoB-associated Cys-rich membrane protein [Lachnospiraceae bacterium]